MPSSNSHLKHRIKHAVRESIYRIRRGFDSKAPRKTLVLYLYADRAKYPRSYSSLQRLLGRLGDVTLVKINNLRSEGGVIVEKDGVVDIAGDNSFWEFSGWGKGIKFSEEYFKKDFDEALFVNDAFLNGTSDGRGLSYFQALFNPYTLRTAANGAIGHVDHAPGQHLIKGNRANAWIRSNIFSVPYKIARTLSYTYFLTEEIDALIPKDFTPGVISRPVSFINDELRAFIDEWLTSKWQFSAKVTPQNWVVLRNKYIAILNERMLSVELRQKGCKLLRSRGGWMWGHFDLAEFQSEESDSPLSEVTKD